MDKSYYSQKPCRIACAWKRGKKGEITIRTSSYQLLSLGSMEVDIYERCDGKTTISEIVEFLKKKYPDIPPYQIEYDTYQFLHSMQSLGSLMIYIDDF